MNGLDVFLLIVAGFLLWFAVLSPWARRYDERQEAWERNHGRPRW